jgi:RNA polymerase sigma-70 factor (ECF subfamily)
MGILANGADAEDACSDAIIKACRACGGLSDDMRFKPWLMRILVRCCYDIIRARKRTVPTGEPAAFDKPVFDNERGSVFELIQELPQNCRKVLILYYYEGFKAKEIARVLSMPAGTVLVNLSRGRAKLRALLEREEAIIKAQLETEEAIC